MTGDQRGGDVVCLVGHQVPNGLGDIFGIPMAPIGMVSVTVWMILSGSLATMSLMWLGAPRS